MATENPSKIPTKNYCKICDYYTSSVKDFKKHLLTSKHKKSTKSTDFVLKNPLSCECGKSYKDRSGLWRHKKKCTFDTNKGAEEAELLLNHYVGNEENYKDMFIEVMKKHSEITEVMMEQQNTIQELVPKVGNTTNTTNNSNTTNNNFNINIFLNEQCKDAMNLTDFMNSIQLSIEDVTNIGENGQTTGFANILIEKLTSIDLFKRPLHCSDAKRETLYIKNNNEWNKEDEERTQLKDAIDHISFKGIQAIPDLNLPDEKVSGTVQELVKMPVDHKKIIAKVAKQVKI